MTVPLQVMPFLSTEHTGLALPGTSAGGVTLIPHMLCSLAMPLQLLPLLPVCAGHRGQEPIAVTTHSSTLAGGRE